jgi:hypothetical protein
MNRSTLLATTATLLAAAACALPAQAATVAYITDFTKTNDIQTGLISTFPTGIFTPSNSFGTSFDITSSGTSCGIAGLPGAGACNYYDGFGFTAGKSLTVPVGVANVTSFYTLMNAYWGSMNTGIVATVEFVGSGGATETFNLYGGSNIRDFFLSNPVTNNTINGTTTQNAFACSDPSTCLGAGATGNVTTGRAGNYGVDEQQFVLNSSFAGQTLVDLVITNECGCISPILLGATAVSSPVTTGVPEPATLALMGLGLAGIACTRRRRAA